MKTSLLIFSVFVLSSIWQSKAQDFTDIVAAKEDANIYLEHYSTSFMEGLLYATSENWYTTAKPLKAFKFEFDLSVAGAFVPKHKENFTFNDAEYKYLRLESGSNRLPTAMGENTDSRLKIIIPINNLEVKVLELEAGNGIKEDLPVNAVPAPNFQLSMGLPMGTEVGLRYLPGVKIAGGSINMLGIGVKHSISQYFSSNKKDEDKSSNFNLSVIGAFNNINIDYQYPDDDRHIDSRINSITFQAIASMDYKIISLFGAFGYSEGFSRIDALGTFKHKFRIEDNNGNLIRNEVIEVKDPLHMKYSVEGFESTFGFRLNLTPLRLYASYALQEYPTVNVGFGVVF